MTGTDRLVLRNAPDDPTDQQWAPWPHPWPPPPRLLLVNGLLANPADQPHEELVKLRYLASHGLGVREYVRNRTSHVLDPAPEDADWFRGAEYVPAS